MKIKKTRIEHKDRFGDTFHVDFWPEDKSNGKGFMVMGSYGHDGLGRAVLFNFKQAEKFAKALLAKVEEHS